MKRIPITIYHRFLQSRLSDSNPNIFSSIIGRHVLGFLETLYSETQYLPQEILRAAQEELLRTRLTMFVARNQFYRTFLTQHGIHLDEIQNLHDLRLLPIITKTDFRRQKDGNSLTHGMNPVRQRFGVTSGSTGEPFNFATDRRYTLPSRANFFRVWRWADSDPYAPVVSSAGPGMAGATPHTIFFHPHEVYAKRYEFAQQIRASGARAIRGNPLTNFELGTAIREAGALDIRFDRAFFMGNVLLDGIRRFFTKEFGADVYDFYATQEFGPVAAECPAHQGLHIFEENFIFEIVDERGIPVPDGTRGKVLITSLLNEVMPFIRYAVGDTGTILSRACPCGRTLRRLIVEGRNEELLIRPDGQHLSPTIMRDVLDKYFDAFERYRVIQQSPTNIRFEVMPTKYFSVSILTKATRELRECIGNDMVVEPSVVTNIPLTTAGKLQYFSSELWRQRYAEKIAGLSI